MMRSMNLRLIAGAIAMLFTMILGESIGFSQIENRTDVVSAIPFDKTVKQIEIALKEEGMMIIGIIDHQGMMKMVGVSMGGSKTIEFGKPEMGKMIFPDMAEAGLELPAKIYIWERKDGKTVVSYMKPSASWAKYNNETLKKVGEMMTSMMEKVVAKGTR